MRRWGAIATNLPGDPDDTERARRRFLRARGADREIRCGEPATSFRLSGVRLHIERWSAERRDFEAETAAPVTLALKLLNYPAWDVRVDGQDNPGRRKPGHGADARAIAAGRSSCRGAFSPDVGSHRRKCDFDLIGADFAGRACRGVSKTKKQRAGPAR